MFYDYDHIPSEKYLNKDTITTLYHFKIILYNH